MTTPHVPRPLLSGRRAVVTGGAEGIGGAIVAAFVAHGAEVVAVDCDDAALGVLVEGVGGGGPRDAAEAGIRPWGGGHLHTLALDVTEPDAPERVLEACGGAGAGRARQQRRALPRAAGAVRGIRPRGVGGGRGGQPDARAAAAARRCCRG